MLVFNGFLIRTTYSINLWSFGFHLLILYIRFSKMLIILSILLGQK